MLENPNDLYHQRLRTIAGRLTVASIPMAAVVMLLPKVALFEHGSGSLVSVHLLMEMFSVLVSLMVVATSLLAISHDAEDMARPLVFGFTVVAGVDLFHALSVEGMPTLLSESSTSKAIFFWLCGRTFELLIVTLVLLRVRLPGSIRDWLIAAILVVLVLVYMGTRQLNALPALYVPGQGVTAFKAWIEVILSLANFAAAASFWRQYRNNPGQRSFYFACSCFIMGVGELMFTSYVSQGDIQNVLGHLFKIASYGAIYIGTFILGMREPYEAALQSEAVAHAKQIELDAVMRQVPAAIFRLDKEGRFRYINELHARILGKAPAMIVGRSFEDIVPESRRADLAYRWAAALQGAHMSYEAVIPDGKGTDHVLSVSIGPETDTRGDIVGTLGIALDTTSQRDTQRQLLESLKEVSDFKTALDAHAIVAVTDPRGVITRVNDKFCEISKYSRLELVGSTHRIINSGHHPKSFFTGMWRTIGSGEVWSGEICNRAKDGSLYWVYTTIMPIVSDKGQIQSYVAIRADITERKLYEEQVQTMAYQDLLTELPNRRLLMDRLQQSLAASQRSGQHGAVVFLDLDHFKRINDTKGHEHGDALLQLVASRLKAHVRQSDTVARFGGDEFVVVYGDLGIKPDEAIAQASYMAEALLREFAQEFDLMGSRVNCTSSLGVVMYQGSGVTAEELLKQADIALYQAKAAGRNSLFFFDPVMQQAYMQRVGLEADLRHAMANGELHVVYQPIVDVEGRLAAAELLLRWSHPELGEISPVNFIPVAEDSGLIIPIGSWVLEQGCQQLAEWSLDPISRDWKVSINVSARQIRQVDFVEQVLAILSKYNAPPEKLKLEITEGSLLQDLQDTVDKMNRLVAHGVAFAMDDFGTGYSSLSYLKKLPLSVVKIDRSFVMNLAVNAQDVAIAKTVIALGQNLELTVVAEGVETEQQWNLLRDMGCNGFQGYLFSRPIRASLLVEQVRERGTLRASMAGSH